MRNIARTTLPVLVVLALSAAGCGSGSDSGSHAAVGAPVAGGSVHVVMQSLFFAPTAVHAKVGQRVVWTNRDSAPHNVTYVSGPRFRSSRTLHAGARFAIRLTAPGTIHYFCSLHPWMKATIDVSS
jgi:plastocyanin